jgi:transcription initiation factor IIE alpha subunit
MNKEQENRKRTDYHSLDFTPTKEQEPQGLICCQGCYRLGIKEGKSQANEELKKRIKQLEYYDTSKIKEAKEKVIKEFKEKLKENWKVKARRMNIMSEEVAIYELKNEIDKTAEEILSPKQEKKQ